MSALTRAQAPRAVRWRQQAVRLVLAVTPAPPVGFWRWALRKVVPGVLIGLWFAGLGAWLFAVASS